MVSPFKTPRITSLCRNYSQWLLPACLAICIASFALTRSYAQHRHVDVIRFDGSINPASADYLDDAVAGAARSDAEAVIIQLNTPGGLLASTRKIVSVLLTADVPIIVYVSPSGSQAASAGVFLTLASNFAAMAPGTNIGAAHPVLLQQQMDSIMMQKSTNDAAAFIRSISEKRHRNVAWAEDAVRKSVSRSETEALKEKIIDTVANTLDDLLVMLDGKQFETGRGMRVVQTHDAEIIMIEPSTRQKLLDIVSDPNITYILLMLGIWGLMFELYNPGLIFPGIVGFISLVLSGYALNTLPVNYAGVGLIVFAVVLFILEIKIVSHGLLAAGGILSLLIGSMMLFKSGPEYGVVTLSWPVLITTVIVTASFFLFIIGAGLRAQRRKPATGPSGMIGEIGEALGDLQPDGTILVHGEIWRATSMEGTISKGARVRVETMENMHLKVKSA